MKTFFYAIALLIGLSVSTVANAQKFDEVFEKYQNVEGVQAVKINDVGPIVGVALEGQDQPEIQEMAKNTSSVRVLVAKPTNDTLDKDVRSYVKKYKMSELLVFSGNGQNIGIYMIDKNEVISEIVVSVVQNNEHVVVNVNGRYPLKTVQELIRKNKDKLNIKF